MDAISWRRLTSMVKSDLLYRSRKQHLGGADFTGAELQESKNRGIAGEIPPNRN
jgi:hypothetical protein